MKNLFKYLSLVILTASMSFPLKAQIIPQPKSFEVSDGTFLLNKKTGFNYADEEKYIVEQFVEQLNRHTGIQLKHKAESKQKADVVLVKDKSLDGKEAYKIEVTQTKIEIKAASETGLFYGMQSLLQLAVLGQRSKGVVSIPVATIHDEPLFAWRGLMLDESRHFFGKEKVKDLLDWMAFFKLNKFHWHLTDEPGWRIEIKKYPKLTTVGGKGNWHDPEAPVLFYTQEDIKEIVQYAAERNIEVIPEIDMPGHATAANRAYPEFSGGGSEKYPEFTFNPGKEGTYGYLTDILNEVTTLFPSKWIHIGGDEVHFGNHEWKNLSEVQELMKRENLETLRDVENMFLHRMNDSVVGLDKKMIGWDEIVDANIPSENSMVMWWRHNMPDQLTKALNMGYNTVLCPRVPLYFDFVQKNSHKWGRKWGGKFVTLDNLYAFPESLDNIPEDKKEQVLGIQANVWTEKIQNQERFDYMIFPRIVALAESAWTSEENKDFGNFNVRLKPVLNLFDQYEIYYFNPFNPELTPEPAGVEKE